MEFCRPASVSGTAAQLSGHQELQRRDRRITNMRMDELAEWTYRASTVTLRTATNPFFSAPNLCFLIPMVGSAIARYKVESKGATYCNLGGSAGNEWRRSLCTLQRFSLALVEAYCHMLIDGGTVSRVRRSQDSVTGSW